jgi:hypothetical protein
MVAECVARESNCGDCMSCIVGLATLFQPQYSPLIGCGLRAAFKKEFDIEKGDCGCIEDFCVGGFCFQLSVCQMVRHVDSLRGDDDRVDRAQRGRNDLVESAGTSDSGVVDSVESPLPVDSGGAAAAADLDTVEAQLAQLKGLYEKQLITQEIYEAKQKELLSQLMPAAPLAPADMDRG